MLDIIGREHKDWEEYPVSHHTVAAIRARVSPPFYFEDGADVGRAAVVVWLEAPSGLAVTCTAIGPGDVGGAVTRVLLTAGPHRDLLERAVERLLAQGIAQGVHTRAGRTYTSEPLR